MTSQVLKPKEISYLEVGTTQGKGKGVFAKKSFAAGEIVCVGAIEEVLKENNAHAIQIGENTWVLQDEVSSTVNHSCSPNCGIHVNETGAHDYKAMKDIAMGEEITFDYAMQNYTINYFPYQCQCGSNECRGSITGWKDLPTSKKREYQGFVPAYLLEVDKSTYD